MDIQLSQKTATVVLTKKNSISISNNISNISYRSGCWVGLHYNPNYWFAFRDNWESLTKIKEFICLFVLIFWKPRFHCLVI